MFLPAEFFHCWVSLKPQELYSGLPFAPSSSSTFLQNWPKPSAGRRSKSGCPPATVRSRKSRTTPVSETVVGGSTWFGPTVPLSDELAAASEAAMATRRVWLVIDFSDGLGVCLRITSEHLRMRRRSKQEVEVRFPPVRLGLCGSRRVCAGRVRRLTQAGGAESPRSRSKHAGSAARTTRGSRRRACPRP